MLGLIVSGRPVQTFQPVDASPNRFMAAIADADSVNHIVVFLSEPLPDGLGAGVYFSWPNSEGDGSLQWLFLGVISNTKPSAIYKLVKPKQSHAVGPGGDAGSTAMTPFGASISHEAGVGISIEPLDSLAQLQGPVAEGAQRSTLEQYCGTMLDNFVNYVASFAITNPANPSDVYVPMKTITAWFDNFRRKLNADPNFWKS